VIARAAASVILAGALVLGTAGCSFFATQQTTHPYDASDGVGTTIGNVKVRNVIALVGSDGQAVSLIMTVVNDGKKAVRFNIGYTVNDAQQNYKPLTIGAGKVLNLGYDPDDTSDQVILIGTGGKAGDLIPIWFPCSTARCRNTKTSSRRTSCARRSSRRRRFRPTPRRPRRKRALGLEAVPQAANGDQHRRV
jgi:hypothetical protein